MSTTLIKLNGTSGDLKEMTTAEEAYIAYQVSVFLANTWTNTDVGSIIVSTDTLNQYVGSYTNNFFNQAVGTHPSTSISSGSTTTSIKQKSGTYDETGLIYPISWESTGTTGINEMTSSELDTICDRLLAYIATNQMAGTLKIESSAPTNYTLFTSNLFSDTRTDGTSIAYNLYKRTTLTTAPTTVRPVKLADANGNLKEMTDTEIQNTFGRRIVNRMISEANRPGRYLLLTSGTEPSASGYPGTWIQVSTGITDTKQSLEEVNYTGEYTRNSTTTFTNNSTVDFVNTYSRTSTRTSLVVYGGRILFYYLGNYIGNFMGNYTHDYIGDYVHDYIGNYVGDYVGQTISSSSITTGTYILWLRTA